MKRTFFGLVAAVFGLTPAVASTQNPSPYQTRDEQVGAFRALEVRGPFSVSFMADADNSEVLFSGPAELLADAIATVEDGVLIIKFRESATWSWNPGSGMHAVVKAPSLDAIKVSGPARVRAINVKSDTFSASIDGAGTISIKLLDAKKVEFAVGGSGSIYAEGTAHEAYYALGGSGSIEGKRLRANTANIALGGAGSIYADVSNTAAIAVGGNGRVEVVGGAECTKEPVDSPNIECR